MGDQRADLTTAAQRLLTRWRADPVLFAQEALGVQPYDRQAEVMRAIARHGRATVRSGHKTGKSHLAAMLSLWWPLTQPWGQAVFTAPSYRQVEKVIWKAIRGMYTGAPMRLGGSAALTPIKGIQFPELGSECFGLTARDPESFAGLSGNILLIVDEASGFDEAIFDAVFGTLAGGVNILLIGNPTRTSGTFYDSFHAKAAAWPARFKISSRDTPNFRAGEPRVPGLADPSFLAWAREQWGEGTPQWDVRIEGDFPRQGENVVVALHLVEVAKARWEDDDVEDGPLELGVDVARFGDDETVIYPRRGHRLLAPTVLHSMDTVDVAGQVLRVAAQHRTDQDHPPRVKVDVIGVGAGVVDHLSRHERQVEVVGVDVGRAPTSQPEYGPGYSKLRDQLWFGLRDWLEAGGTFEDDVRLESELVAALYDFDERGRYRVERKEKVKARLKRSPDRADAAALAVYEAPANVVPERSRRRRAMANTGGF